MHMQPRVLALTAEEQGDGGPWGPMLRTQEAAQLEGPTLQAVQGDADDVGALSPAWMPQAHPAPFITAVGGLESDEFKRQNALIAERWKENHRSDIPLPGTNHLTICDAFAIPGDPLFYATVKLLESLRAPG